jgi:hypothetical protein
MSESCLLSGRKKLPCSSNLKKRSQANFSFWAGTPAMNCGMHLALMFWKGNKNKKVVLFLELGRKK